MQLKKCISILKGENDSVNKYGELIIIGGENGYEQIKGKVESNGEARLRTSEEVDERTNERTIERTKNEEKNKNKRKKKKKVEENEGK